MSMVRQVFSKRVGLVVVAGMVSAASGCGPELGAWIYTLNLVPKQKIPAEYKLPPGPIMVLVDDDRDLIQPPLARSALVDALATELKAHELAERVTTNEELARLKQSESKFDQRGARELGQLAGADTVILLNTQAFSLEEDLELMVNPARFAVTVRVINAKAESRDQVRLWPEESTERDGRLVQIEVKPHEMRSAKKTSEAHEKMASVLAVKIAELFYDRELEG